MKVTWVVIGQSASSTHKGYAHSPFLAKTPLERGKRPLPMDLDGCSK